MENFRLEKVQRFEEFVDRRLKPDLIHAIAERDKVFEQQKVFSDLKRNIENLEKNGVTSLRSLVNLGSEVYMKADVPDTRHVFVDIGLGFHVEFTWVEALEFTAVKEESLARLESLDIYTVLEDLKVVLYCMVVSTHVLKIYVQHRQIEEYTRLIASIKAQIKLVCEGIRELLQLTAERSY